MGNTCGGVGAKPTGSNKCPFNKTDRIAIVGGGPAGIHMAASLCKLGYTNIVVLEQDKPGGQDLRFGKTFTHFLPETGDVPHEFGTCYLSASYHVVRELFDEYLGPDHIIDPAGGQDKPFGKFLLPAPTLNHTKHDHSVLSDDWLFSHREELSLPEKWWTFMPDKLQAVGFVGDVIRYTQLHRELLGDYEYHGIMPRPKPKALKLMNKTFYELLKEHNLQALGDLCCVGFGSYGLCYNVPALYGLWFVTPKSVWAYVLSRVRSDIKPAQITKHGYGRLWQAMVNKHNIKIRYDVHIRSINRQLDNKTAPVLITMHDNSVEQYDFVICAAPMQSAFASLVVDKTPLETAFCNSISCVNLNVILFRTQKKTDLYPLGGGRAIEEQGLVFYPESLQPSTTPHPSGEVYAERNNVKCYRPELEDKMSHRYISAYQYYPTPQIGGEEQCKKACIDFVTNPAKCLVATPAQGVEVVMQKNWTNYFPHVSQEAIQNGLPWNLYESQGMHKCFYVGSSVCFESVEDVCRYNNQVLGRFVHD